MRIERASFYKNPFIGLFLKANEKTAIAPPHASPKIIEQLKDVLGVEVHQFLINQSALLGLYSVMNSKGVVLPTLAKEAEEKAFLKMGYNVCKIPDAFSAASNNVLANDHACLVNPGIPQKTIQDIRDCLDVEVHKGKIAGISTVGAINVVTNKGLLAFNDCSDNDLQYLEKLFKVKGSRATANLGVPFNSINLVANSKGVIVGESTTGFEIQRIYEALST